MSYYQIQRQREVLSELEDESLSGIAAIIIDLREKLEEAEERIAALETELEEAQDA